MKPISPDDDVPRLHGVVENLLGNRGCGFILGDDMVERFFHVTEVEGSLFEDLERGDSVTFVHVETGKGPRANRVRKLGKVGELERKDGEGEEGREGEGEE